MEATLRVSTGAKIIVWRIHETYHARLSGSSNAPQICLAIDLFEVIADLSGLDLENGPHAAEAMALADRAQRLLGDRHPDGAGGGEESVSGNT
jgi:hypothetical protein